ncbi:FAD-dependent oxidoreductase [Kineococcus sp. R8]|uniref:FAD-dependent oxidoreductase n=1 Tax=Kineococcus siccus TaxID=2696567 RepID=UPI0014134098|nr:FAD-dependent oxidoreductase [Kineococcus siccus]
MSEAAPRGTGPATERVVDVVVVGAGFAGIGTAVRLARRGRESYVVLERGADLGGTWRDNTYPGVACDIPSHLYSFSFAPKPDWSRVFAPGAEIQQYLRDCARTEGVLPHLRTGAEVLDAAWDGTAWRVRSTVGDWRARTLVIAVGRLSEPRRPDVEGLADFGGEVVHSSRWADGDRFAGRRVGVVGTGASAVQIVPALARAAAGVVVFQRSAPYVLPRQDRAYTPAERRAFTADPALGRRLRAELFERFDEGIAARQAAGPEVEQLRRRALDHLAAQVPDPVLRARLTPDYEVGCKRVLLSDDYYPALQRPGVVLEPAALQRLEAGAGVAANGARHALDALVLATGFLSTTPPFAARVRGREGLRLAQHWAEGMVSFASTVVHGFPNMFVLDGPNASLGHNSAVHMIETQIGYVLGALDHLAHEPGPLEVSRAAERAYTREVDALSARTVWLRGGCRSWYVDERSGRQTLLWPASGRSFAERNGTFDPAPFRPSAPLSS